jgi:hypothetical protein
MQFRRILKEVRNAPDRLSYTDAAITPQMEQEFEKLDLYHATTGGEAALLRKFRLDAIRTGTPEPAAARPAAG